MKRGKIYLVIVLILFLLPVLFLLPWAKAITNPAAFYCQELGYDYEIRMDNNSNQYGICIMPDKSECKEWQFYESKCGKEFAKQIDISKKLEATALKLPAKSTKTRSIEKIKVMPKLGSEYNASDYSEWDWRDPPTGTRFANYSWLTSIKDQGLCGSCWAFAALGVVEALYKIYNNDSALDLNLSEQELVSCSGCGNCIYGGNTECALNYTNDNGSVDESCFSYTASDDPCNRCSNSQDRDYKITGWFPVSNDTASIKQALIDYGPLSAAVYVDKGTSGNELWENCSNDTANHAVVLVAYNDSEGNYTIKNSWGNGSGNQGYHKLPYGCIEKYDWILAVNATEIKPNATLVSPSNNFNISAALITFNCSAQDLDGMNGLQNITLYGNFTGSWQANQTQNISGQSNSTTFTLNLTNNTYVWACFVSCQAKLNSWSENRTLTIDQIPPAINLESPGNNTVENATNTIIFSYNVSDGLAIANCSLYLNNTFNESDNLIEKDTSQNFTKNIADGNYSWFINCVDSVGNSGQSETRQLQVTADSPSIALENPTNALNTSSSQITFNCSATDNAELKNLSLYIWNSTSVFYNNSTDITGTSNSSEWQVDMIANQQYNWSCLVYDNANLSTWASNRSLTIDTVEPTLSIASPITTLIRETIWINYTGSDALTGIEQATYNITNSSGSQATGNLNTTYNTGQLTDGNYTINYAVSDYADNSNSTTKNITVDNTNPSVNLTLSDTSINEGNTVDITCDASDDNGIDNITITYDNTTIKSCASSPSSPCDEEDYEPSWTGVETITCRAYDEAGNSNADTENLDVDEDGGGGGGNGGGDDNIYSDVKDEEEKETEETEDKEATYDINTELEANKKETKKLAKGESVGFKVKNKDHIVEVDEIYSDKVKLKISSDTFYITIEINETKKVDTDDNGLDDLAITLLGIENESANLQFELLEEQPTETPSLGAINESSCGNSVCEAGENCTCEDCPCAENETCIEGNCFAATGMRLKISKQTIIYIIIGLVVIAIIVAIAIFRKKFIIVKYHKHIIIRRRHY